MQFFSFYLGHLSSRRGTIRATENIHGHDCRSKDRHQVDMFLQSRRLQMFSYGVLGQLIS